jgi:hypothetical protein
MNVRSNTFLARYYFRASAYESSGLGHYSPGRLKKNIQKAKPDL